MNSWNTLCLALQDKVGFQESPIASENMKYWLCFGEKLFSRHCLKVVSKAEDTVLVEG
jgi:hypothetical protein